MNTEQGTTAAAATAHGYGALFRGKEFRALWTGNALGTAATSMAGLSLGLLVNAETGSALLTALVMFGPSLIQLVGASTLMSVADTVPPRPLLTALSGVMAAAFAAQALFDLTPIARLMIVLATAYVLSIAAGARWGVLSEVAPAGHYALARSAMNASVGVMQIVGFAVGGALSTMLGVQAIFWVAVAATALAAIVNWFGIRSHRPRRIGRPSLRATWHGNRILLGQRSSRVVVLALCVPNGLVAGCEAIFVPYAGNASPVLFVAGAIGMLAGDLLAGRLLSPGGRRVASPWMRILLPVPFLLFLGQPPIVVAAVLVGVASIGYAATLGQQELLVTLTPADLTGQVLGAESAARVAFQGLAATLAGVLAELMSPLNAIVVLSACSLAVSLLLTPGLRRAAKIATPSIPEHATH